MSLKNRISCLTLMALSAASLSAAEWGAEAAVGGNPTAYYQEEIKKQNSQYRSQVAGRRHALSFTGKVYYEWIGLRFWSDSYFGATGKQKLQYQLQGPGNSSSYQNTEVDGVPFSAAQSFRAEIQLRKFYYGHREFFSFNLGLLYRSVTTDLQGQPADYVPQTILTRYATAGLSFEPLLTNFGKMELSLPVDFSLGLKFPEGGLFDSGGVGAVFFGAGLRLGFEPRGAFATAQGVVNFHDTPYNAAGAKYTFSQLEVTMRLMVGYYFRNTVYHE